LIDSADPKALRLGKTERSFFIFSGQWQEGYRARARADCSVLTADR
jgi:hypothetical protein